ncbi:MAG: cell surface protein SprA, partial [Flavobacteriaceae bacterium]|nr:cell surface protein SprA [Flavobacteriaceae bacterium]
DINADLKPFKDLTIELAANKTYTRNQAQQIDAIRNTNSSAEFNELPVNETGNFAISYFMLPMSFDGNGDATFEKFKQNRAIIRQRLAESENASPDGFGLNSQQVLIPAFLATYSGQDAGKVRLSAFRNIPIPGWRLNYRGFMNFAWFKKHFSSFTVEHGYQSTYSIIGFNNNLLYNAENPYGDPNNLTGSGDYQPEKIFNGLNLIELFNPLVKIDFRLKSSLSFNLELKTDKQLSLNVNNNTLTEVRGKEYVAGIGYRFKDVRFKLKTGEKLTTFKGDINLKANLSIRNNSTVVRSIDIENNQVTGGQNMFAIKLQADYALNKNLLASFFYDQNSSRFLISTTFPRKSINAGITLRYTIGN